MKRTLPFVILVVLAAGIGTQPAVADDNWTEDCNSARTLEPGTYTGTLSPGDTDAFEIRIPEGDSVNVTLQRGNDEATFRFDEVLTGDRGDPSDVTVTEPAYATGEYRQNEDIVVEAFQETGAENDVQFEIYHQNNGGVCLPLQTQYESASDWAISFARNDVKPPELVSPEEVQQLQTKLDRKDQRISELQTTVAEQKQRIKTLKTKLDNTTRPIEITVEPEQREQSFTAGGTAIVTADAPDTVLARLTLDFGGESYTVGSDGRVAVPLEATGEQRMVFSYADARKSVTLNVVGDQNDGGATTGSKQATTASDGTMAAETSTGSAALSDSDGDGMIDSEDYAPEDPDVQQKEDVQSDARTPGFGITTTLVALLSVAVLAARRT